VEPEELNKYIEELAAEIDSSKGNYPEASSKETIITLFKEILGLTDAERSSKVGYLRDFELGSPRLSVRDYFVIAEYAKVEGFSDVFSYLRRKGDLTNVTSLSRDGKLLQTPFTVKRVSSNLGTKRTVRKSGLFGNEEVTEGGDE
jgi:hypothetical protein